MLAHQSILLLYMYLIIIIFIVVLFEPDYNLNL